MSDATEPTSAERPTNPAATVAVLFGLLLCIPATGLIAVPAAALGLRRARSRRGVGLKPARIGLVLGIINLVWWPAIWIGALSYNRTLQLAKPAIDAAGAFVFAVGRGDIANAKTYCTDAIDETRLTDAFEQLQRWGSMDKPNTYWGGKYNGPDDIAVNVELKFEKFTKILATHWKTTPEGPRLKTFEFQDPPGTQPTTQKQ